MPRVRWSTHLSPSTFTLTLTLTLNPHPQPNPQPHPHPHSNYEDAPGAIVYAYEHSLAASSDGDNNGKTGGDGDGDSDSDSDSERESGSESDSRAMRRFEHHLEKTRALEWKLEGMVRKPVSGLEAEQLHGRGNPTWVLKSRNFGANWTYILLPDFLQVSQSVSKCLVSLVRQLNESAR